MRIEQTILKNLIYDEEYLRQVSPFLQSDYFTDNTERILYNEIASFISDYNAPPSVESIAVALSSSNKLNGEEFKKANELLEGLSKLKDTESKKEWLLKETESFCQNKAIYNAVASSINILDGRDKSHDKGAIPKLLQEALAVSFDTSVGHDYIGDALKRYEHYHKKEERLPFDLEFFNKITKGGLKRKTLTVAMAGPNVGKSLWMCHCAASWLALGKNVLYITMEMAEEEIGQRIDANLMDISLDDLMDLPEEMYVKRISKIREKTVGELKIKEYPTAAASVTHFRTLLNELKLKQDFKPDVIIIDYLNICCSSRIKLGANIQSYGYVKAIAEELRGLAVETNTAVVTATQSNRTGFTSSDPGLEDTSESFGVPATADLMFVITTSEELDELNQYMIKQLKSRYANPGHYKRFVVGVDKSKFKLYDVEQSAQEGVMDAGITPPTNKPDKFADFTV